jgi:hypothetical protein
MTNTRQSKMNDNEIYASSLVDTWFSAYRSYAQALQSGANMATAAPPPAPTGVADRLKQVTGGIVQAAETALPDQLKPYAPYLVLGAAGLMVFSAVGKGRR